MLEHQTKLPRGLQMYLLIYRSLTMNAQSVRETEHFQESSGESGEEIFIIIHSGPPQTSFSVRDEQYYHIHPGWKE